MSETNPDPLPTFKMEVLVTIINGFPIYAKSPALSRRLPDLPYLFIIYITPIIVIL